MEMHISLLEDDDQIYIYIYYYKYNGHVDILKNLLIF